MGLSRSTFYASQKTTPAQIKTDELAEKISEVQSSCFFTIGRRRMGAVLHKRYGIEVCETTLQRIMSRRTHPPGAQGEALRRQGNPAAAAG